MKYSHLYRSLAHIGVRKTAWGGSLITGSNYLTDRSMMFRLSDVDRLRVERLGMEAPHKSRPQRSIDDAKKLWKEALRADTTPLGLPLGDGRVPGSGHIVRFDPADFEIIFNVYKVRLLLYLTGADELRGTTPEGPTHAHRDGGLVGVIMGLTLPTQEGWRDLLTVRA